MENRPASPPWPWLLFGAIAAATVAFATTGYNWSHLSRVPCWPDGCFCEAGRAGPIAQPSDTYSNLAFVLAGLLVLGAPRDPQAVNPMRRGGAHVWVYGLAVVTIGLGSWFYHASLTYVGRWFDVMGMYLLATFIVLYNIARLRPIGGLAFSALYIALNIVLGVLLVVDPPFRRDIFMALILIGIALEALVLWRRRPTVRIGYYAAAVGSLALAYFIWNLDLNGTWCDPHSWVQGHAVWHLLDAAAAGLLYLYYRSSRT